MSDRLKKLLNIPPDNSSDNANSSPKEWQIFSGNAQPNEFSPVNGNSSRKKTKKSANITKILSFVAATVATFSVGSAVMPTKNTSEILECYSTDRSIGYFIMADESKHDLVLVVENDNTHRIIDLKHGENMGDVLNLKPNMQYTLKLAQKNGVSTSAKSRTIRTQNIMNESVWYGLEYTPAQDFNGTFKFTPYYSDPQNQWVDFGLSIFDRSGYGLETSIEGSGIEHSIPLSEFILGSSKGYFEIYGITQNGEEEYLYGREIEFTKKHTEWLTLDYNFDVNNPTSITFTPTYIDENGLWQNLTAKLIDANGTEYYSAAITKSGAQYKIDLTIDFTFETDLYLEIYSQLTFNDYQESLFIHSATVFLRYNKTT